jgi:hypothetical protein
VVDKLPPQDGEEVGLDAGVLAEGGEAFQEVEEGVLDDVLGVGGLLAGGPAGERRAAGPW